MSSTPKSTSIRPSRAVLLGAAAIATAALIAMGGCTNDNMAGMDHGAGHSASPEPSTSAEARSSTPAAGPHNQADVMFALMMIPHHNQAIEMSDILLAKEGIDPEVTA